VGLIPAYCRLRARGEVRFRVHWGGAFGSVVTASFSRSTFPPCTTFHVYAMRRSEGNVFGDAWESHVACSVAGNTRRSHELNGRILLGRGITCAPTARTAASPPACFGGSGQEIGDDDDGGINRGFRVRDRTAAPPASRFALSMRAE